MQLFHVIEDGAAILRIKGGSYRQAKIYRRGSDVFAQVGGGYVRLLSRSGTTTPNITYLEVEAPGVEVDRMGVPRFVEVEEDATQPAA